MSSDRAEQMAAWTIVGAVVLAIVLRSIGLAYGLPAVYNPDEVAILNRALSLAETRLDPRNFLYPSLYFYALFVWEGLWFVVGRITGVFDSLAAFERAFFIDPSSLYLAGRILSVICGAATVVATWQLGRRLFGSIAGVAAALLLAVAPLAVRDAHYVKHDVPVTLLIVLTHLVIAADLMEPAARRRPILAGVLAGLAVSTHYYAVFLALPLAVASIWPVFRGEPVTARIRRLTVCTAAGVFAFAATSPFLLLEPMTAWRDIVANRQIVVDRATTATGVFGSLGFYLDWLRQDATGTIVAGLAVAGCLVAVFRGWRVTILVLLFPAAFMAFIANTFPASRYLNPILPFLTVLAGATVAWVAQHRPGGAIVAGVLLAAALTESGRASLRTDLFIRRTDTRTLGLDWINQHAPDGASVLVQPYSVPLRPSRAGLVEALTANLGAPDNASVKFRRQLDLNPYPAPSYRTLYLGDGGLDADKIYVSPSAIRAEGLAPLRALSVTYIVLKQYNVSDPSLRPLVEALQREGQLVARFSPYPGDLEWTRFVATAPFLHNSDARIAPILERPGPIIEIWTIH